MKREKNYNIELLRVIACIMVVCIHVCNYYSRGYGLGEVSNISYIFSIILNGISRVAVPIFFMISGSLLIDEVILVKKSLRRAWNMLLVLAGWSGIYCVWNYLYRGKTYDIQMIFAEPVKRHLWYLYVLLGLYLILPFLQCMFKNMPDLLLRYFAAMWFVFMTADFLLAFFGWKVTYQVPLLGNPCYIGYFVMGYIIKKTSKKVPISGKLCYGGAVFSLAVVIILTYMYTLKEGMHFEKMFENRNILIAISAALIFYDAVKNEHRPYSDRAKKILGFLSKHSFHIYLCHGIFLDIVKLEFEPRSISAFVGIPVYIVFIFVSSLLFSIVWKYMWGGMTLRIKDLRIGMVLRR